MLSPLNERHTFMLIITAVIGYVVLSALGTLAQQTPCKIPTPQPTPSVTTVAPVFFDGTTPQPDFAVWFWDDLTSQGLTYAVKAALGMGRNEDGWIEYWAMLNLGMTREQAEGLTRALYRALYGEPDPRPFIPTSDTL